MSVTCESVVFDRKVRAIVCFGPATDFTGFKAGDYYQVTIDPDKRSPGGDYIRFGLTPNDEINGWQRISALTVCEVLEELEVDEKGQTVTFSRICDE